jgi:hypothetical protein
MPDPPSTAELPTPPSERRAWLLAGATGALGLAVLVAALIGLLGAGGGGSVAPPPVPLAAATPVPAATTPAAVLAAAGTTTARRALRAREAAEHRASAERAALPLDATRDPVAARWMEGFYPIYATAQDTFGVNWLLLASIHMQESAFSTAPGTYHGLNFAHCCGGPMQFNVTNGPLTTWDLVSNSFLYGRRPSAYDHMTATHPSIYDDFDAIMAAAHLLSADGAGYTLDGTAWSAAYDYYGHDADGVAYADEVIARAIGWSQQGFCINCGVQPRLVQAVAAAYGAPVLVAIQTRAAGHGPARATAARRRH